MNSFGALRESLEFRLYIEPVISATPRLLAMFVVLPFFVKPIFSGMVRAGFATLCAFFVSPRVLADGLAPLASALWWAVAAKEVVVGIMIAFVCAVVFWAVESVGYLIDLQTGASNAQFFDPASGHESGPTGNFLRQLSIAIFMSFGGLQLLLGFIFQSYRIWPVNSFFPSVSQAALIFFGAQTNDIFSWALKLAAPVLIVLIGVELVLGLVGRYAEQLNVFSFAQPIKALLAVLIMAATLHLVYDALAGILFSGASVQAQLRQIWPADAATVPR